MNSRDTFWGIVSMRWLLALFCLSFITVSQASAVETLNDKVIEKVLVLKSAHQLQLINDGKPIKTYRISLGKNPRGPKLMEGDKRTPEGFYWIDWRKTSNNFNLAMHISYPNITDSARARREGVAPGGMIMIHGTPDTEDTPEDLFHTLDWTDGCVAMRNRDMREVWNLVPDGTMIEIRP
jgi:murein L,D-transpeptidase YafK